MPGLSSSYRKESSRLTSKTLRDVARLLWVRGLGFRVWGVGFRFRVRIRVVGLSGCRVLGCGVSGAYGFFLGFKGVGFDDQGVKVFGFGWFSKMLIPFCIKNYVSWYLGVQIANAHLALFGHEAIAAQGFTRADLGYRPVLALSTKGTPESM